MMTTCGYLVLLNVHRDQNGGLNCSRLYLRASLREAHSRPMHVYLLRKVFSSFKRFSSSSNDPGPLLSASRASATMASRSDSHVCWIPSAPSVEDAPRSLCKVA